MTVSNRLRWLRCGCSHRWLTLVPLSVAGMTALDLLTQSHNDRDGPKLPLIPLSHVILSLNDASALSTHCDSPFLSVFQCFREDALPCVQNHRLLPSVSLRFRTGVGVGKILQTAALTPTPAKAVDSNRLQHRSRRRLRSCGTDHYICESSPSI